MTTALKEALAVFAVCMAFALLISGCQANSWRCMATPTLPPDAREDARSYGFEVQCTRPLP